jgi:signal transduction histidine kinase/ActR/RegA family two-component response regulator
MIRALGQFVEGHDEFQGFLHSDERDKRAEIEATPALALSSMSESLTHVKLDHSGSASSVENERFVNYDKGRKKMTQLNQTLPSLGTYRGSSSHPGGAFGISSINGPTDSRSIPPSSTLVWPVTQPQISRKSAGENDRPTSSRSDSLEDMLARATNLIREAIGLDGVLFLDPRSSGGQLLAELGGSRRNTMRHQDHIKLTSSNGAIRREASTKNCRVMSASTKDDRDTDDVDGIQIPESTLQYLLERFPAGGVLHFDRSGLIGGTEWASGFDTSISDDLNPPSFKRLRQTERREFFVEDGNETPELNILTSILPGVTSVLLFPLWDSHRDKWLAYGLAWTTDLMRVFQREDFTYLSSFGNAVMADLSRLETIASDKAKTGFISSISHELRSPLHGIMAGMEVLRELVSDPTSEELFNIVETCGFALLDTIDNLLAFAKISRIKATEDGKPDSTPGSGQKAGSLVNLGTLVEDIISVTLAGNQFRSAVNASELLGKPSYSNEEQSNGGLAPGVTVICDIARGHDWQFQTEAGAWKRILLNLLGNSLKYTSIGLISVKLSYELNSMDLFISAQNDLVSSDQFVSATDIHNLDSRSQSTAQTDTAHVSTNFGTNTATLVVEDTGKGMSQDYMTHFMFKPFYQENQMSPGTGLGLSIVSQLVSSLGGTINVSSKEGLGTKITVQIPLGPKCSDGDPSLSLLQCDKLRLGFFGSSVAPISTMGSTGALSSAETCSSAVNSLLSTYATNYGIFVTSVERIDSNDVEILAMWENAYRKLSASQITALRKPIIVLLAKSILPYGSAKEPPNVVLLSQPYGPHRFGQALKSCLYIRRGYEETTGIEEHQALGPEKDTPLDQQAAAVSLPNSQIVTGNGTDIAQEPVATPQLINPTILLVEDNHINLKLLATGLGRLGFAFTTAMNGAEAVEAYEHEQTKFPLIFMDIQMPVMDGLEASRLIRQHEKRDGLARSIIVALTGLSSAEAKQKALDCGVDLFLTKPVSMMKLKELVLEYCVKTTGDDLKEATVTNSSVVPTT